jgi:shikimate kinase/3-dehydroquinate synthase
MGPDSPPFDTTHPRSHDEAARDGARRGRPNSAGQGWSGPAIVLVGLMGAGKTAIGKRIATRFGLPFVDADHEIEEAAGMTVAEIFSRYGEQAFRDGERRVIARLLAGAPVVLATGGGAFMDDETRALVRARGLSVWLRVPLPVLVRRVSGRTDRPLLTGKDAHQVLGELAQRRYPIYAEADIVVDCADEPAEGTTNRVAAALAAWSPPLSVHVPLAERAYDILIGPGLISRAGAEAAAVLPRRRAVVIADETVAALHGKALAASLDATGFSHTMLTVPAGEQSKSMAVLAGLLDRMAEGGIDRRTGVIALGGGVVGDLAGFAAAVALRGLPFIQIPTTLLAQVDSSVGGKTGVNLAAGKNLVGAFHQPLLVLCDTDVLATLPLRERRAGYAEVVKYGLIDDQAFFAWCEANGEGLLAGDADLIAEAVRACCAAKARVVADDERETRADGGRALLNLGHTFGHALEAEVGYDGARLLHGEAVAVGMGLAFSLSARLGLCAAEDAARVRAHLAAVGLPAELAMLNRRFSAQRLIGHMRKDKKAEAGRLTFILARGIGAAFVSRDVPEEEVVALLSEEGCES